MRPPAPAMEQPRPPIGMHPGGPTPIGAGHNIGQPPRLAPPPMGGPPIGGPPVTQPHL